jgi:hypothetical protein
MLGLFLVGILSAATVNYISFLCTGVVNWKKLKGKWLCCVRSSISLFTGEIEKKIV